MFEPQVQAGARDSARRMYDEFLDTMNEPFDPNKTSEPEAEKL